MVKKKKQSEIVFSRMNNKGRTIAKYFREFFKDYKYKAIEEVLDLSEKAIKHNIDVLEKGYAMDLEKIILTYQITGELPKNIDCGSGVNKLYSIVLGLRLLFDMPQENRLTSIDSLDLAEDVKNVLTQFIIRLDSIDYNIDKDTFCEVLKTYCNDSLGFTKENAIYGMQNPINNSLEQLHVTQCNKAHFEFALVLRRVGNLNKSTVILIQDFVNAYMQESFKYKTLLEYFKEFAMSELIEFIDAQSAKVNYYFGEIVKIVFGDYNFKVLQVTRNKDVVQKEFKDRSWQEIEKIVIDCGYCYDRSRGDHGIYINKEGKVVVVPRGRVLGKGIQLHILKTIDYKSKSVEKQVAVSTMSMF